MRWEGPVCWRRREEPRPSVHLLGADGTTQSVTLVSVANSIRSHKQKEPHTTNYSVIFMLLNVGKPGSHPPDSKPYSNEGPCLNLVSFSSSNVESSCTDPPGQVASPSQVRSQQCWYSFAAKYTEETWGKCGSRLLSSRMPDSQSREPGF